MRRYITARQEHLGNALDYLQFHGKLRWHWQYDATSKRAIFHIEEGGRPYEPFHIWQAEDVAQEHLKQMGVVWFPVKPPGGQAQLEETLTLIRIARASDSGGDA